MKIVKTFSILVSHPKRVLTDDGLGTRVIYQQKEEQVSITIDFSHLLSLLGHKACTSKGGVAKEAKGAVVVKQITEK